MVLSRYLGATRRGSGYMEGNGYIVSWCFGHLVELAPPIAYGEQYKRWDRALLPIIPEEWKYIASEGKQEQLEILRAFMNRSDVETVVNACDAGREGELIFRLVYEYCACKKPIQRLWLSSMEESAIAEAFLNLRSGAEYENLYHAALCRARADWIVGMNATRLFTSLYGGATLNVGRVQSPTLAMLAEREAAVAAFVPEPFYTPFIDIGSFSASGERLKAKEEAEAVRAACDGGTAAVVSIERKQKSAAAPKLYDLTTLQREANRILGYTAQQTLDYLQALYEKKLTTYPRTDSRYLTEDMAAGLTPLVKAVAAALPFIGIIRPSVDAAQVVNNAGVSDHHAIIPTPSMPSADLAALPDGERNILYMVAIRLVCAVENPHTFTETAVTLECGGHTFAAKGKTVISKGWTLYEQLFMNWIKHKGEGEEEAEAPLPELSEGQAFVNVRASVKEGVTSPPKHFTEDTLLSGMENTGADNAAEDAERKGLGTPATRAGIIEKLIKSGFVERKKKNLVPTQKGVNLIAILPNTIKSPLLTAQLEHRLLEIERGRIAPDSFMEGIADMTRTLVAGHTEPAPEYAGLFAVPASGDIAGACPRCGKPVRENKKAFSCEDRACGFVLWKDNKFFAAKKKTLDKKTAAALLKDGRVFMSGLYSEKTGKNYDAFIVLEDTGKYANFKIEFKDGGRK